jgi:hypothetical protein
MVDGAGWCDLAWEERNWTTGMAECIDEQMTGFVVV